MSNPSHPKAYLHVLGVGLALLFAAPLFLFQVPQTELVVVTTFGRFSRELAEPGLYLRWPWPVQKVFRFDRRMQAFERKFEQTTTADGRNLLATVFIGWRVADGKTFLERFPNGDLVRAGQALEAVVRDAKNGVLGRHPFGDLITTNRAALKLRQVEDEMLDIARPVAAANYGVEIELLGLKQLGLPESITTKVFDRMRSERQRLVKQFQSEGEAESIRIRADADRQRQELLAQAEAEATALRGQAEAEAARAYAVFEQNPDLAVFLLELNALGRTLKERSTLVLDPQTPPFNLLRPEALQPKNLTPPPTLASP